MSLIATEKVKPLIDELVASRGSRSELAAEIATSGRLNFEAAQRRLYAIQSGETEFIHDDVLDAILCGADALYLWHMNEDGGDAVGVRRDPGPKSFLPQDKVRAAYTLYRSGMSSYELGALMYKRYGYKNASTCGRMLTKRFRHLGYERRSKVDAGFARYRNANCGTCGVSMDNRTAGCSACSKRHHNRKVRNHPSFRAAKCSGCGCGFDERTRGCSICTSRHYWRRHHSGASVEVAQNCAGCGTHYDFRTPGCASCRSRHHGRHKRALVSRPGLGGLSADPEMGTADKGRSLRRAA